MSNYFRALNRILSEQGAAAPEVRSPLAAEQGASESNGRSVVELREAPVARKPAVPPLADHMLAKRQTAFAKLFDNLRVLGNGTPIQSVVLAGASQSEAVKGVTAGLVAQAYRQRLRTFVAELVVSPGATVLKRRSVPFDASHMDAPEDAPRLRSVDGGDQLLEQPIPLDLRGGPLPMALQQWLDDARTAYDLVIVEAPPLGRTVDSALVARACDGLIIVVDSEQTAEEDLQTGVERSLAVGCRVLGLVMNGVHEWLPKWVRRLGKLTTN